MRAHEKGRQERLKMLFERSQERESLKEGLEPALREHLEIECAERECLERA